MRHRRELQQLTIDGGHEVVASLDLSPTWGGARKGAGRPKRDWQTRTISVRVPLVLYNAIIKVAEVRDETITQYLTEMLTREVSTDLDAI